MSNVPDLTYFSPESTGGLADYAHEQATALSELGARVSFVTVPSFTPATDKPRYALVPILANPPVKTHSTSRLVRRLRSARWYLNNVDRLADFVTREKADRVVFGAYCEYLAPLWAFKLRRLAARGVVFGAVVHDPVRRTSIGPRWWNRKSIVSAYSFTREAFVHDPIELDTGQRPSGFRTTQIPHGPYRFAPPNLPRKALRERLKVPDDKLLLLAFGHIRNSKNLDLVLQAMVHNPGCHLLVAGRELGSDQRPAAHYQELAAKLGVAERCRWKIGFVPGEEIGNLFEASDLVLLTYNRNFVSASGVLNVAIQYRKPCIASGGKCNLRTSVKRYGLGIWVEPDDPVSLSKVLASFHSQRLLPDWPGYERDNSWEKNASLVLRCMTDMAPVPARVLSGTRKAANLAM